MSTGLPVVEFDVVPGQPCMIGKRSTAYLDSARPQHVEESFGIPDPRDGMNGLPDPGAQRPRLAANAMPLPAFASKRMQKAS